MIVIHQPSFDEILAVARDLRPEDAKELSITRNLDQPARLAASAWTAKYRRMAYIDDTPVFAFGMTLMSDQQGQVWGFGTSQASRVMHSVTKFILRSMIPDMLGEGLLAVQAITHPSNALSTRWLRRIGFAPMAITVPGIGAGTHPMILWITVANEHRHQYRALAA
jgi:hypothetical protein